MTRTVSSGGKVFAAKAWIPSAVAVTSLARTSDVRGAGDLELLATLKAELRPFSILELALRAFHPGASRKEERWGWLGVLVLRSVLNSRK